MIKLKLLTLLSLAVLQVGCINRWTEFVYDDAIHMYFSPSRSAEDNPSLDHIFIDFLDLENTNNFRDVQIRTSSGYAIILNSETIVEELETHIEDLRFVRKASLLGPLNHPSAPNYKYKEGDFLIYRGDHMWFVFNTAGHLAGVNFWTGGTYGIKSVRLGSTEIKLPAKKDAVVEALGEPKSAIRFYAE